jgi:hypothetical protein
MRASIGLVIVVFGLAACMAKPAVQEQGAASRDVSSLPAVPWQGHELREVTSLAALPAPIRQFLGVDYPGLDGVADRGQPFNGTDAIDPSEPRRRLIAAGHAGNIWLVALEQGGFVPSAEALQFSDGIVQKGWSLYSQPTTLSAVVQEISAAAPTASFTPTPSVRHEDKPAFSIPLSAVFPLVPTSPADAAAPVVRWQGHRLREVTSLAALPAAIRQTLRADEPGLAGIADRGKPFNATDAIVEPAPMRRFITAGQDGDLWLVALEQGGYGYSVQILEFSGGMVRRRWEATGPQDGVDSLGTLDQVVRRIRQLRPED